MPGEELTGRNKKILWWIFLLAAASAAACAWFLTSASREASRAATVAPATVPQPPRRISSLGRIEPFDGIVRVSARSLSGQPSIVSELRVKEGDWVKAGQILAVLDSRPQLEAVVHDLDARVAVAQQRLAVAKAGGKKADTTAGQAEIARLEAVLANARQEADRYEDLYRKGSATVTERDQRRVLVDTTVQAINVAKARVAGVDEIREADVNLAEAEVRSAQASVARAGVEVEVSVVRAPSAGRVLKVNARKGEEVGPKGIVELGRTDRMCVIAEVFESDVNRVQVGQAATITGEALKAPLHGKVEFIGMQVAKDNLAQTDPVSLSDARVVEVKIRLNESEEASRLIHGQVTALIEP